MDLSRLTASVAAETSVDASAAALLSQLSDLLKANANDPAAINALADQLDASSTALTAAITQSTPVSAAQAAAKAK